jgi:hypothetical protein
MKKMNRLNKKKEEKGGLMKILYLRMRTLYILGNTEQSKVVRIKIQSLHLPQPTNKRTQLISMEIK